jgi:hypothetical protein
LSGPRNQEKRLRDVPKSVRGRVRLHPSRNVIAGLGQRTPVRDADGTSLGLYARSSRMNELGEFAVFIVLVALIGTVGVVIGLR